MGELNDEHIRFDIPGLEEEGEVEVSPRASEDVEALGTRLRGALKFVCKIIGDDPWARW